MAIISVLGERHELPSALDPNYLERVQGVVGALTELRVAEQVIDVTGIPTLQRVGEDSPVKPVRISGNILDAQMRGVKITDVGERGVWVAQAEGKKRVARHFPYAWLTGIFEHPEKNVA